MELSMSIMNYGQKMIGKRKDFRSQSDTEQQELCTPFWHILAGNSTSTGVKATITAVALDL